MEGPARTDETLKEVLLSSARSPGFWSSIAAVVGVAAAASGGVLYLSVDEIRGFSLGVLIAGLSLLFLALVLAPRTVVMFLFGRQGRYGTNVVVMTVAFFAIAVLVNFLLFRSPSRFDLTYTRVFTLAPQTVKVLNNLDTPVRANAFFIPDDARTVVARQQAEDLFNEFEKRTRSFSYRVIDPELNRSLALKYDVESYPAIVFEDVESGVQQAVASLTEQDIVTAIKIVTGEEQKRVYYLTGHKEASITRGATCRTDDDGFDCAVQGMGGDNYRVDPLNLKQHGEVPEDAAVLVIAGPEQDLDAAEQEALAEYIRGGGRIVALFDPETPDSFVDLISRWGATLGRRSIADTVSSVAGEKLTPLVQRTNGQYIPGVPITDPLDVTFFRGVTSVESVIPPAELPPFIRFTPLAMTTPASWLEADIEDVSFDLGVDDPGPFVIATVLEVSGTVDETERHDLAKLVIFGDSDFAKNRSFFSFDNADFFLNSVNWLAEDFEFIEIRPKLFPFRDLVVNTREKDFIKWSSWFFPPSLMIILGVVVWWRRR